MKRGCDHSGSGGGSRRTGGRAGSRGGSTGAGRPAVTIGTIWMRGGRGARGGWWGRLTPGFRASAGAGVARAAAEAAIRAAAIAGLTLSR